MNAFNFNLVPRLYAFSRVSLAFALLISNVKFLDAATPTGPVPKNFFGMHVMQTTTWPLVDIGTLGKAPGTLWPMVERQKGQFDWSILDAYVNSANAHGVGFMYSPLYVPVWASNNTASCKPGFYSSTVCTSGVKNIQDWRDFMTALVIRYKGRIEVYELWMEPQNHFVGTMAELVALTNAAHDVIQTYDPAAKIISPSMVSYGSAYLDQYFAAGGTKDVDAIAMHAYPNPNNCVAEFIRASVTTSIQAVMAKYGLSGKPLWDTETSWGQSDAGAITDPDLQAAFVARNYLLHWSMGITRAYWYAWDNSIAGTMWSSTTGVKKPGTAFKQVSDWMVGSTMRTCVSTSSTSVYDGIYTCDLTRSDGSQARAIWNVDGASVYTVPSNFTQYRQLDGSTISVPSTRQVSIGLKPILLEGSSGSVPPSTSAKFETESLSAVASGAAHSIIGSSSYSGSKGTLLASTATGPSVTYTVNVPAPGTYNVRVAGLKGS
jgi:hypothetical protein